MRLLTFVDPYTFLSEHRTYVKFDEVSLNVKCEDVDFSLSVVFGEWLVVVDSLVVDAQGQRLAARLCTCQTCR